MALFRRAKGPDRDVPRPTAAEPEPSTTQEPDTDTVGNPVLQRDLAARHSAPEAGPTRAELRMLQFVVEGRVARTITSPSASFWRVDGAFATGTKASMLDWLLQQEYLELGPRIRVSATVSITDRGQALLDGL